MTISRAGWRLSMISTSTGMSMIPPPPPDPWWSGANGRARREVGACRCPQPDVFTSSGSRARDVARSTAAIGGVAVGGEQQRNVVMLHRVADLERHDDFRMETRDAAGFEPRAGV